MNDVDLSPTASYFGSSLSEWKDLNLSANFTAFAAAASPLSDSLPQVLHHEERIMELLMEYIKKEDAVSLEPLLDLLAAFAHDLGAKFEKHFETAVDVVCRLAARHLDAAAIEWSFNCLAWVFKYLSRLLVLDLRPLYDLMAPLLGKERQKRFIARFAAEALSFLVKKAGAMYHRDKVPLRRILQHMLDDVASVSATNDSQLYKEGVMTLIFESMKGVQKGFHSSSRSIFGELISIVSSAGTNRTEAMKAARAQIFDGVLTAVIHHADSQTFKFILDLVLESCTWDAVKLDEDQIQQLARFLFIVMGVRKGSRIADWAGVMDRIQDVILPAVQEGNEVSDITKSQVISTVALALHSCPLDVALPYLRMIDWIATGRLQSHFLEFCQIFSDLGSDRFKNFALASFQR